MRFPLLRFGIVTLFSVLSCLGCASQKGMEQDPPFSFSDPVVQAWSGGRESSGSGFRIRMRYSPHRPSEFRPDTLYFRGKALQPQIEDTETGMILTATYENPIPENADRIMHADGRREVGNQPPLPLEPEPPFPFKLEPDQAVLTYVRTADGARFYTRIDGIREKPARLRPGRPQH